MNDGFSSKLCKLTPIQRRVVDWADRPLTVGAGFREDSHTDVQELNCRTGQERSLQGSRAGFHEQCGTNC